MALLVRNEALSDHHHRRDDDVADEDDAHEEKLNGHEVPSHSYAPSQLMGPHTYALHVSLENT
jgi:hypothetical protein